MKTGLVVSLASDVFLLRLRVEPVVACMIAVAAVAVLCGVEAGARGRWFC